MRRRLASLLVVMAAPLSCGPVQMECNVCGQPETFTTCHDLYCRYLAAASLCAATDLESCYSANSCPTPYFLFCPADTRNE